MLTGLPPERSGKTDNSWAEGEPTVKVRTLFDVAKGAGYRTAFFYSKEKLGYLSGAAVDERALAPEEGVARAGRAQEVERGGDFLLVVTSDHAGHGLEHGTDHPEDARLPLILRSDKRRFGEVGGKPFDITGLMPIVAAVLQAR